MDISLIVIKEIVINWFNQWIEKYFFRKSKLRYSYKQRLKEIIDDFAPAMKYSTTNGSLFSIISLPDITDANKNIEINDLKKITVLLGKWYSLFSKYPDFIVLKHISYCFEEFAQILYKTHEIFNDFFRLLKDDDLNKNKLKNNSSYFPFFERIYTNTINSFEKLCKESSKKLKNEFKKYEFDPLPKF